MSTFITSIKTFLREEDGAELVEWSVFVAVLVISIVAAIAAMRTDITELWAAIGALLDDAQDGQAGGAAP